MIFKFFLYIKKIIPFLLLVTVYGLLAISQVRASQEFETTLTATYTVAPDGATDVAQHVTLTNRFSNIYATQYALEVGSTRIKNIAIKDGAGQTIPHTSTQTQNTTAITLNFSDKIVGKGKAHIFTISYQNLDIAAKTGHVLEVNIPRLSRDSGIENYSVNIIVPQSFGDPSIVTPKSYSVSQKDGNNILTFTQDATKGQGITALYGDKQVFRFTLNYHLENPTTSRGITQIALPPDTSYQKLLYTNLDPKPERVTADPDGNWLATYTLKPKERLDVIAQGQAEIFLKPQVPIPPADQNLDRYLTEQPYWPVNAPEIKDLADRLKTPKAIYDYLVDNFSYDYQRLDGAVTRLGAADALKSPTSAICQEFTDTFITLARAAGIPARELNGFAYTQNSKLRPLSLVQDVLHAWPEYYDRDRKVWVPIDPTWGNTTGGIDYFSVLDLNHFVFAVHGQSSSTPYAAGYYKYQDTTSKDILVEFTDQNPEFKPDLSFATTVSPLHFLGLTAPGNLSITNRSGFALYNTDIALSSQNYQFPGSSTLNLPFILPFGEEELKFNLKPPSPLQTRPAILNISYLGQQTQYEFTPTLHLTSRQLTLTILGLGTVLIVFALITWSLLVHRRGR